jgi:hypothetical protein
VLLLLCAEPPSRKRRLEIMEEKAVVYEALAANLRDKAKLEGQLDVLEREEAMLADED